MHPHAGLFRDDRTEPLVNLQLAEAFKSRQITMVGSAAIPIRLVQGENRS
jgi:hypothetical protein